MDSVKQRGWTSRHENTQPRLSNCPTPSVTWRVLRMTIGSKHSLLTNWIKSMQQDSKNVYLYDQYHDLDEDSSMINNEDSIMTNNEDYTIDEVRRCFP
jgi:hypothetical protein